MRLHAPAEGELMVSAKWACQKYQEIIDNSQKSEQFHISLNALNALVDRLNVFEEKNKDLTPIQYHHIQVPALRKFIHPGYKIRESDF